MDKDRFLRLKEVLDQNEQLFNNIYFIEKDPISIPHSFTLKQDIEIMGFFASVFAWGQRQTIIKKCRELSERMDDSPFEFVSQHRDSDLKRLLKFKHRTFNDLDLLYFIDFLKRHYTSSSTLEEAFLYDSTDVIYIEKALSHFYNYFFENTEPNFRTRKHISTPAKKSACKRLNMYLRWMVRHDDKGVDFGIWKKIKPENLICPLDVHVDRTARHLGLITRKQTDWLAAMELTEKLRLFDESDPVKYDFALFGLSIKQTLP